MGTAACNGKEISFEVRENDSLAEGLGDDPVNTNPSKTTFVGTSATTIWTAEYQQDGLLGIFDPPEYYFRATLVDNPSQTVRSTDPMLEVEKGAQPIITPTPLPTSPITPTGIPTTPPQAQTPSPSAPPSPGGQAGPSAPGPGGSPAVPSQPGSAGPAAPSRKLGDVNADGKVNILDLSILLSRFNKIGRHDADLNNDGKVNIVDLSVLLSKWGK